METGHKPGTYGELLSRDVLLPFLSCRDVLNDCSPNDIDGRGLVEVANAVMFDEIRCKFKQVYPSVPLNNGRSKDIEIPMDPKDVCTLTHRINEYLNDQF